MAEKKVNVIRNTIRIGDYNPSNGVYLNSKVSSMITWTRTRANNPLTEFLVIPHFKQGDSRLAPGDLIVDAGGHRPDCTLNFVECPSYHSEAALTLMDNAYDHFFQNLKDNHSGDIRAFSFAGGNSEEHYLPYASNYPGGPGCSDGGYGGLGDYSQAALSAWRVFLTERYGFGTTPFTINGSTRFTFNAPLPVIPPDNQNNRYVDYSRAEIREVSRFWNRGVFNAWKRFRDKAKQYFPNTPVEYFVADMFNQQGIQWIFNAGTMYPAMQSADIWYHTDNISPSNWTKNLIGTDILKGGSFGSSKISAIEYDVFDAGGLSGPINFNHVKSSIIKFIQHGGQDIHWALNWTDSQIDQLGQVMQEVMSEYINNPGWVPQWVTGRVSAPIVFLNTHSMFNNGNYINAAWEQSGNSFNNPFAANIVNVLVNDTFPNTPNP